MNHAAGPESGSAQFQLLPRNADGLDAHARRGHRFHLKCLPGGVSAIDPNLHRPGARLRCRSEARNRQLADQANRAGRQILVHGFALDLPGGVDPLDPQPLSRRDDSKENARIAGPERGTGSAIEQDSSRACLPKLIETVAARAPDASPTAAIRTTALR